MAYGVCSIAAYLLFLIWVIATRADGTNPNGSVAVFASNYGQIGGLASTMGTAFSIQGFFVPVLKRYKNDTKHISILGISYLIGTAAYIYIAFIGSFGIYDNI